VSGVDIGKVSAMPRIKSNSFIAPPFFLKTLLKSLRSYLLFFIKTDFISVFYTQQF
jgi:hypothetical protein